MKIKPGQVFKKVKTNINNYFFNIDSNIWVRTNGIFYEAILINQYYEEKENDASRKK